MAKQLLGNLKELFSPFFALKDHVHTQYLLTDSLVDELDVILDEMFDSELLEITITNVFPQQGTPTSFALKNFVTGDFTYIDEDDNVHLYGDNSTIKYLNNEIVFLLPKSLLLEEASLVIGQMYNWAENLYFYNLNDSDNDKKIIVSYYNILKEEPSG